MPLITTARLSNTPCVHCRDVGSAHLYSKCMFSPSQYKPMTVHQICDWVDTVVRHSTTGSWDRRVYKSVAFSSPEPGRIDAEFYPVPNDYAPGHSWTLTIMVPEGLPQR